MLSMQALLYTVVALQPYHAQSTSHYTNPVFVVHVKHTVHVVVPLDILRT